LNVRAYNARHAMHPDASDRDKTITRIRAGLKARSGKPWSVTGGRGTAWGWIRITAPPSRRVSAFGSMTEEDAAELARLLGYEDGNRYRDGHSVPAASDYRTEFIDRAEGRAPRVIGAPYWD
jgi:hypothetical protein